MNYIKKRGIALFITLSLIMIITILVAKSLEISQNSLNGIKTIKKINQTNYLFRDVVDILSYVVDNLIPPEDSEMALDYILIPWEISDKGLTLRLSFKPLNDKLDINYYLKDGNTSRVFDYFFETREVANPPFFYDLLQDTFDLDDETRGGYDSEIIINDKNFVNGIIYDYQQFEKILDRYSFLTNDVNIYKIPWREILFFGDGKDKKPLYANLLTDSLIDSIGLYRNKDGEKYEDTNKIIEANSKELVDEFNLKVFTKGSSFLVLCKIEYIFDSISGQITLIYDLGKKEVVSVEEIL